MQSSFYRPAVSQRYEAYHLMCHQKRAASNHRHGQRKAVLHTRCVFKTIEQRITYKDCREKSMYPSSQSAICKPRTFQLKDILHGRSPMSLLLTSMSPINQSCNRTSARGLHTYWSSQLNWITNSLVLVIVFDQNMEPRKQG